MDARKGKKIWPNPTNKEIKKIIEDGIAILQNQTQKALKDFKDFIQEVLEEKEVLR